VKVVFPAPPLRSPFPALCLLVRSPPGSVHFPGIPTCGPSAILVLYVRIAWFFLVDGHLFFPCGLSYPILRRSILGVPSIFGSQWECHTLCFPLLFGFPSLAFLNTGILVFFLLRLFLCWYVGFCVPFRWCVRPPRLFRAFFPDFGPQFARSAARWRVLLRSCCPPCSPYARPARLCSPQVFPRLASTAPQIRPTPCLATWTSVPLLFLFPYFPRGAALGLDFTFRR